MLLACIFIVDYNGDSAIVIVLFMSSMHHAALGRR